MRKKKGLIIMLAVLLCKLSVAETLNINQVPMDLPRSISVGIYSPMLEFEYSGLQQDDYVLKIWLLDRGAWNCASSKVCEKTITIDNSGGTNTAGVIRIIQNIDVYNYSNMDFVARLYRNSSQVAWDEQYVNGVSNRPPVIQSIPSQNCLLGQTLTFQASATDPEGNPVTFWASGLPAQAIIGEDGSFSWTPQAEGIYEVCISADDGTTYDSQNSIITVGSKPEFADVNIPLCGSIENVTGQVKGIGNVSDYKVISYIFVSGNGWWTKPYANQPKTSINADGSFTVDITTGGIDGLANIVYLGICETDAEIPVLSGASSIPDNIPVLNSQKFYRNLEDCHSIIEFSGYLWYVKNSGTGTLGPGPCYFSDSEQNVFVDEQGRLHLKISDEGNHWNCAEVICLNEMGYGTYTFELASDPSVLDKNAVLGLYTWANDAINGKEIDIEYSRWGDSLNENSQFVVQPWDLIGHIYRFETPTTNEISTHRFKWQTEKVGFQSFVNSQEWPTKDSIVADWAYMDQAPELRGVHARINLWLNNNIPPSDGISQEVIIKSFNYKCLENIEGDVNNDCHVDIFDLSLLAVHWLS